MSLSVVLSAREEANRLPITLAHLAKELVLVEPILGPIEVVIVDDASRDGSARVAAEHLPLFSNARLIQLPWTCGKGTVARAGVAAATGRIVTFIDAAGNVDAAHLTALVGLLEEADVVLSYCPPVGRDLSLFGVGRQLSLAAYRRLGRRLTATAIADGHHHFAAIRTEAAKPLFALLQSAGFTSDVKARIVMLAMGLRIVEFPAAEPTADGGIRIPGHQSSAHQDLVSEMFADLVRAHRHRARAQAAVRRSVSPAPEPNLTISLAAPGGSQPSSGTTVDPTSGSADDREIRVMVGSTMPAEESRTNR